METNGESLKFHTHKDPVEISLKGGDIFARRIRLNLLFL